MNKDIDDSHLNEDQRKVLREAATEAPYSGALLDNKKDGNYQCAACSTTLFESGTKFDSHCGWPSFDQAIKGSVIEIHDSTHRMSRTEVICANCKGHLGHVFDDGPKQTTGLRYCINSLSLDFLSKDGIKKSGSK